MQHMQQGRQLEMSYILDRQGAGRIRCRAEGSRSLGQRQSRQGP